MARFDLYPNGGQGFLLDVQTDLLGGFNSRIVVPLMPPNIAPFPGRKLNPTFVIGGMPYVMVTQYMGSVAAKTLSRAVGNLYDQQDTIAAAIDMIFLGF